MSDYQFYEVIENDELTVTSFLENQKSIVGGISRQQFLMFDFLVDVL